MATEAGWYGDPWGRSEWRWFDGVRWTEHTLTGGTGALDPASEASSSAAMPRGPSWCAPVPVGSPVAGDSAWRRFRRRSAPVQIATWCGAVFAGLFVIGLIGSIVDPNNKDESVLSPSTDPRPVAETSVARTAPESAPTTDSPTTVEVAPSSRADDVARCKDGTFSANTDFSATCSRHDGVDAWLASYGRCADEAIIAMSEDNTCDDHDGFDSLMPTDFVPSATDADVARCTDGLFSANTDFGGTCSSHGGVDKWLANYGSCADGTTIAMSEDASCEDHGGFAQLMPADYVPTTTTLPPTTTTAPVALLSPCAELQERSSGYVCAITGYGPLWIEAPFSENDDQVMMLPAEATADGFIVVDDMALNAAGFQEFRSYRQKYWCVSVALKNLSSDEQSYNMFDFQLLTPSGSLQSPTIPLVNDFSSILTSGGLAPQGTVSGGICFDQPATVTGRFGLVYKSFSFLGSSRGIYYFDR